MIGTPSSEDLISIVKARYPDLESLAERLIGRRGLVYMVLVVGWSFFL